MRASDLIGKTIAGKYELTGILGEGGMGAVYSANQHPSGKTVAIKVIPAEDDDRVAIRFKREAGVLSGLSHPNTVSVFDYGEADGYLYLAMEILEGMSLDQALRRYRRFSVYDAIHIARQIAASLTEAHQAGIVHRDIKPANIFLLHGEDGEYVVKVLDFGIAKRFGSDIDTQLTQAGTLVGTPRYMPPEQIRTESVDQRTDIYSLGCVLYEMIAGRAPFLSENVANLLIQHLKDSVPPLSRFVSPEELRHIPPSLDDALNRALSKDPRMRQTSMAGFCRDLDVALEEMDSKQRNGPATPSTVDLGSVPQVEAAVKSVERRRPPLKKASRIKPSWAFAGAISGISLLLVALLVFTGGSPTAGEPCNKDGDVVCGLSEFGSKAVLGCRESKLVSLAACENICVSSGMNGASCGSQSPVIAIEGAFCGERGASACSDGLESVLTCDGLAWAPSRLCGPDKCVRAKEGVGCLDNTYGIGDTCDFPKANRVCSTDYKNLLKCEEKKTVTDVDCSADGGWCTRLSSGEKLEITCHVFQN